METLKLITASDLEAKNIPPANWAIEGFIPEGLTILAGAPKSGKSIFALNLALALSSDAEIIGKKSKTIKNVLYLPYEDSERRLQNRIKKMKEGLLIKNEPKTFFPNDCNPPKIDIEDLNNIGILIKENNIDIIIIDTLGSSIKNAIKKTLRSYMDEYELLNTFQRFALNNKISLILLHHTRKAKAKGNNFFDEISGTRGITGSADANFILEKNKIQSKLTIQGRDLEDLEFGLEFDPTYLIWKSMGIEPKVSLTPEQKSIIAVFNNDPEKELKPIEIAKLLNKEDTNIRPTIGKLNDLGLLHQDTYGKYKLTLNN